MSFRFTRPRDFAFVILAAALTVWATPPLALVGGMVFALALGVPLEGFGSRLAKRLLQACVVLLGFGMNLPVILRAGLNGSLFAAATIAGTLALGYALGRAFTLNQRTTALISAGTAICGGSAIAAVGSVISVTDAEIAVAMGTVFLLNAAALYLFPLVGHALHLTQAQFGLWSGVAIHDISSVVGAALSYGPESLVTATAVKLSRTLWIVPITVGMAMAFRPALPPSETKPAASNLPKIAVPWFVGLFLLASLARSSIPSLSNWTLRVSETGRAGMTLVLCLIGASISPRSLRKLGWRAIALGVALWLFISLTSLAAIRLFHLAA